MKCFSCGYIIRDNVLKCKNCGFMHPGYTGDKESYEKILIKMGQEYRKANNVSMWKDPKKFTEKTNKKRDDIVLDDREWQKACEYYGEVIKRSPEYVSAYLEKLLMSPNIGSMSGYVDWLVKNYEKDEVQKLIAGIAASVFVSWPAIPSFRKSDILSSAQIGSEVSFGKYRQSSNSSDGKRAIQWIVLDRIDNRLLLISKYALDWKRYHSVSENTSWEECKLRKWMNTDFINDAFSKTEQAMLLETSIHREKKSEVSQKANPNNVIIDKVFNLSIEEANKYFVNDELRKCSPTEYLTSLGAFINAEIMVEGKATCRWWLRSPGDNSRYAAFVQNGGGLSKIGRDVYSIDVCVRPAMWIDLDL